MSQTELESPSQGAAYHPPQREVRARILSTAGWLSGTYHVPRSHGLAEFLSAHAFHALTDVERSAGAPLAFLSLSTQRTALVCPRPPTGPLVAASMHGWTLHPVRLLLAGWELTGIAHFHSGVRLSDFAEQVTHFFWLSDAVVHDQASGRPEPLGEVLVNPRCVVGITDR